MKDFWDGLVSLSKTLIIAGVGLIALVILIMGIIFGMCLS